MNVLRSPVAALAWEIWRRNRYAFLLLLVFLLLCVGLSRIATHFAAEAWRLAATLPAPGAPEIMEASERADGLLAFARGWSGILFGLSLLVTLALFACVESSPIRGIGGIPSRLFAMPVGTAHLVAVPIALGVGFVACLHLMWSWLVFAPILNQDPRGTDGYVLLLLAALMVTFQALLWTLPGFPKTRVTLLTLLITAAVALGALQFGDWGRWPEPRPTLMTIYAAALVTAPVLAWFGVRRIRRGERTDWPALTGLMTRLANAFSRPRDFASPSAAQYWVECRRNARLALGGLALVVLFILGLNTIFLPSNGSPSFQLDSAYIPVLLFLFSIWTPVLGLMVCGDVASRRLALTTFQAVRPVAVGELVSAKIKAMAAVWLGGWLMAALSLIVWVVLRGVDTEAVLDHFVRQRGAWMSTIVALAVSLHVLVGLFPLWLTGRVPGLPWSIVGLLVAYGVVAQVVAWFVRHPDYWPVALLLIGFGAAVKLGTAALAFRQDLKERLVKRGFVFRAVSIWLLGTALSMQLMLWICRESGWNETLMVPFAALLFPIARIALAPLALARNRHR